MSKINFAGTGKYRVEFNYNDKTVIFPNGESIPYFTNKDVIDEMTFLDDKSKDILIKIIDSIESDNAELITANLGARIPFVGIFSKSPKELYGKQKQALAQILKEEGYSESQIVGNVSTMRLGPGNGGTYISSFIARIMNFKRNGLPLPENWNKPRGQADITNDGELPTPYEIKFIWQR